MYLEDFDETCAEYVVKIYTKGEADNTIHIHINGTIVEAIDKAKSKILKDFKNIYLKKFCIVNVQLGDINFHVPSRYWEKYRNRIKS